MKTLRKILAALLLLTTANVVRAEDTDETPKNTLEFPSPDGKMAFRYSKKSEDGEEIKTYDLIEKSSGKVVMTIAESDPDPAPSARFAMENVKWRSDSKAFALTAMFWKRGTALSVFARDGSKFREIELPELVADIPEKEKKGKDFHHVMESNSQSAKRWQKDGSLVAEIETMIDGEGGTLTALRTVILGFDHFAKAKILKSTEKFAIKNE